MSQREEETAIHDLWSWPAASASDVWAENASPVKRWKTSGIDFEQLWMDMYRGLPKDKLEMTVAVVKRIWGRRNEFIF